MSEKWKEKTVVWILAKTIISGLIRWRFGDEDAEAGFGLDTALKEEDKEQLLTKLEERHERTLKRKVLE